MFKSEGKYEKNQAETTTQKKRNKILLTIPLQSLR